MQYFQKRFVFIVSFLFFVVSATSFVVFSARAESIAQKLSGRILLQVEANGEAWYVNPSDQKRYFMGRPTDAFNLMRSFGAGITNKDLEKIPSAGTSGDITFSSKYKGKIFLQVEENGEAWYIYPVDAKRYYLGRPTDAFNLMRSLGLGITNKDLENILAGNSSSATTTTTTTTTSSKTVSLSGGETVFFEAGDLTRPEFCIRGNQAHVTFRHSFSGGNEVLLKTFDIDSQGVWKEKSKSVLYPQNGPEGFFTDHQLVCSDDAFYLVFEAIDGSAKQAVVYQYDLSWNLGAKTTILQQSSNILSQVYKSDDPGAAFFNNTLWVWVVKIDSRRNATGFALYGLDPKTLALISHDGKNGPIILENPKKAAFPGVMDFINGEYHILSSPPVSGGNPWSHDGLVDYRYDTKWKYLGAEEASHSFGDSKPLYTTARLHGSDFEVWGFTVEPPERGVGVGQSGKSQAVEQYVNVGEAYIRLKDANKTVSYLDISKSDTLGTADDTRHMEFFLVNDTLYVGYQYLTDKSTIIKKYQVVRK